MKRAEQMRATFDRFEESRLSLKAFGEREGIPYTTLQYWRRKLSGKAVPKKAAPRVAVGAALAPVRVVPDPLSIESRPEHFEVWLSNGVSLEIPSGFDELELRRLIGVLSAC